MRVHQPRGHNTATRMNDLTSCRQVRLNLGNDAVSYQNVRLRQLAPGIVHGQDRFRRFNQNILHSHPLSVQDFVSVEAAWKTANRSTTENEGRPRQAGLSYTGCSSGTIQAEPVELD